MDKKKGKLKRGMGILLAVVMLFNTLPISGFAVSASEKQETGHCEHHPEYTAECGYTEAQLCTHEHSDECYEIVTECVHMHTDECYSETEESGKGSITPSDAESREPENCSHQCSEESDCINRTLDCHHGHDESCGYGGKIPCAYDCHICPIEDMITFLLDEVTEDNAEKVRAQLNKILGLYRELTEDEQEQNDLSPCWELQAVLDAANAPVTVDEPAEGAVVQVETDGNISYFDTIDAAWTVANGNTATITLLADVTANDTLTVSNDSTITFDGGDYTLTSGQKTVIEVNGTLKLESGMIQSTYSNLNATGIDVNGKLEMTGGTVSTSSRAASASRAVRADSNSSITISGGKIFGVRGVYVNGGTVTIENGEISGRTDAVYILSGTVTIEGGTFTSSGSNGMCIVSGTVVLRGGTFTGGSYAVSSGNDVSTLLDTMKPYVYFDANGQPVNLSELDDPTKLPDGTYTVGECEHKGVTPTPNNDGTHSLKCPYCGYTGPAEDCSYGTEYQHDDTDHWLTCTACGYENKEAHNWEFDSAQNGNVTENHRECLVCYRTKDHLTLTITVPDGLTYGNTEGKKVTYTLIPEKTCDKVTWRFTGEDMPEFADGVLPANLPVGEHWFRVEGLMSDDAIVFSGSYYLTVSAAPLTGDMVTLFPESVTYSGTEQKPAVTVKQGDTPLAEGTDYDVSYSPANLTNAGTVTITITGKGNYKGTVKKTYSIAKVPLTIKASNQEITYGDNIETNLGGSALGSVVYGNLCTGDKLESINFTPSTENVPGGTIKLSGAVIKNSKGEDVTGNYDITYEDGILTINQAAGKLTIPETSFEKKFRDEVFSLGCTSNVGNISYTSSNVDVALVSADGKVQIKGVGTANIKVSLAESKNYTGDEETVTVTVEKADTPTVDNQSKQYICGKGSGGNTVKTDISEKLPSDRGNTVYTFTSDEAGILSDVDIDENGMLTYKVGTGTADTAASVTVTAEMENYKTVDFVLTIKLVDKIKVEITTKAEDAVYDGKSHKGYADGITCDYPVEGYEFIYNGRGGTVYGSSEPPKDAGSYTVTISVSDKSGDYEEKSVSLNFTVEKASISIKADNKSVNKGAPLPKLTYTVSGLAEKDSLASAPEITCNADTKTEGSYTITVGGAKVPDTKNYNGEITYENGTLTVIKPAGGSSGGSSTGGNSGGGSAGGSSGGGSAGGSGGTGTTLIPSTPAVTTTSDGTVVSLNKDGAYVDKNGKPAADTLIKEPTGEMHVTDSTGHIVKDVIVTTADQTTYVVGAKGNVVVSDIVEIKGNKYVADGKGQLVVSSFSTVGGEKYYSDAKGLVKTAGFFNVSGKKYYADEDGVIAVRKLITVNGRKYFAAKGGAIASKKIVTTGGKKYYAAKSGKIAENKVVKAGGKKYFATKDGSLATSKWVKAGNKKYFCNKKGVITKTKKIKAY